MPSCALLLTILWLQRGTPGSLLPHGYCFTWNPTLLWAHVGSDVLIGLAYVSIPMTLFHLVRQRTDLPFNWIFVLFAIFIVGCGASHFMEVWTVWNPDYWLAANVKVLTAVASVLTAAALIGSTPRILAIPSVAALNAAKLALEVEVGQRRRAEDLLRQERAELERRVLERTEQLTEATTQAQVARAAAENANRMKDRFLAKVSHELRTPLQSTLTWSHLLSHAGDDRARAEHAADRIMKNVRTQARLIDDLLDISRILSGKLALQITEVDAGEVIRKAAEVVSSAASSRGVIVDLPEPTDPIPMKTDPVRLEQVVWNLVNNAVQASPDASQVRVSYFADGDALTLEVSDRGRGIDAADLPFIFEPFRQLKNADNSHRGLGLGLAITSSIVDLFGGELRAHSDGLGRGATFVLRLPMTAAIDDVDDAPSGTITSAERDSLHGCRVVYVEDEPDIAEGGRLALVSLGLTVEVCLDFDAAAKRVAEGGFDLLLCDLDLGNGRNGAELLPLMAAAPGGAAIAAVALSAYGSAEDRRASARAGFASHIVKPADSATIARALVSALAARPAVCNRAAAAQ
jgi:signal transduction histidine kinase/ActR/RegA family two-component response regulator